MMDTLRTPEWPTVEPWTCPAQPHGRSSCDQVAFLGQLFATEGQVAHVKVPVARLIRPECQQTILVALFDSARIC